MSPGEADVRSCGKSSDASVRPRHLCRACRGRRVVLSLVRDAAARCSAECGKSEVGVVRGADRPANDASRVEVEKHREIRPAFVRREVGHVARPDTVRGLRLEVARKQVRRNRTRVIRVGRGTKTPLTSASNSMIAHDALHTLFPDHVAFCSQLATRGLPYLPRLRLCAAVISTASFASDLALDEGLASAKRKIRFAKRAKHRTRR